MAIASSIRTFSFGSVGSWGSRSDREVLCQLKKAQEAAKFGFKRCLIPDNNLKYLNNKMPIEIIGKNCRRSTTDSFKTVMI